MNAVMIFGRPEYIKVSRLASPLKTVGGKFLWIDGKVALSCRYRTDQGGPKTPMGKPREIDPLDGITESDVGQAASDSFMIDDSDNEADDVE